MDTDSQTRANGTWRAWIPYFVLATTFLLTLVAMYYVATESDARDRLRFENSVLKTRDNIENRIETYTALLRAGAGLFAVKENVTRTEFRSFVDKLDIQRRYPGVQGIGYSARVSPQEKDALVSRIRAEGQSDFKVWPEGERSEYFSIIYLEPLDARNRNALGYDMFSESVRRAAMERARDTGLPAASGRVTLIQEANFEHKQAGFLIFVPVYRGGKTPESEAERREKLIGYFYAPFRVGDLLTGIFGSEHSHEISFQVFDENAADPTALLHDTDPDSTDDDKAHFKTEVKLPVAGRTWSLVFHTEPQFEYQSGRRLLPFILLVGGLVSLTLFAITRSETKARKVAERTTKELLETEQRAVKEYERMLERITALAHTLATARELRTIYAALREFALISVPCIGIFISLYDPEREVRLAAYGWGDNQDVDVSQLPPMPISKDGPNSRAVRTGEVIITDDYLATMRGHPTVPVGADNGLFPQSSLVVPMTVMRRIVGTIEVQSYDLAAYKEEHITAMRMAANLAAVAIENVQLFARERSARADAEAASRTKDEFLATVSHELRTPLTSMIGWTHMLRTTELDEAVKLRAIETIERNAKLQAQIVDDILDVSRIITGKLSMDMQPVDIAPLIETVINAVRPAAAAKEIRVETEIEHGPHLVSGDANRLQQVFWNVLSNAVKFTPRGGTVRVQIELVKAHLEIKVTDTGLGINKEFLPYVFDRFRQADSSTTRTHGGLGLGLAIVRHLVEMHGGSVSAESPGEGLGATFILTLPLAYTREPFAEQQPVQPAQTGVNAPAPLKGLHVLVVDDELDTLDIMRAMLESGAARVSTAASVSEAMEVIEVEPPDVVISDIGMPVEDGYDLLRKLRLMDTQKGTHMPAIALTAYTRDEDREYSLAQGFQAYLTKPVEPSELISLIAELAAQNTDRAETRL